MATVRKWVQFDPSQPKAKRRRQTLDDPKPKRACNSVRERITVWDKVQHRKLSGNAAPLRENLNEHLQLNPVYEVYVAQDHILAPGLTTTPPGCMEFTLNAPQQTMTVYEPHATDPIVSCIAPPGMESADEAYIRPLCRDISTTAAQGLQPSRAPQRTHAPPQAPCLSNKTPVEDEAPLGKEEALTDAVAIIQILARWLVQSPTSSAAGLIHNFLLGNEGLTVASQLNSEFEGLLEDSTESSSTDESQVRNEANASGSIQAEDSGSVRCTESTYKPRHAEDEHIEEDCSQDTLPLNMDEFGFEQSFGNPTSCELTQMLRLPFICRYNYEY